MRRTRLSRKTRIRSRSPRRATVKQLDDLLRQLLLARDGGCVVAGQGFGECGGALTVSHIRPKGKYPGLRHEPDNAAIKCWRHHLHWWHKDVTAAGAWFRATYPERAARLDILVQVRAKPDRTATRIWLEQQLAGSPASCAPPPL